MIEVPENLPIPIQPDASKGLAPSAVKRSHPPFHDPNKEGEAQQRRKKKRERSSKAPSGEAAPEETADDDARGSRIDLRA